MQTTGLTRLYWHVVAGQDDVRCGERDPRRDDLITVSSHNRSVTLATDKAADDSAELAELRDLGRYALRRLRGMAQPGDPLLEVRITLADVDSPRAWRKALIPVTYPLNRVHAVIQAAMGWEGYHLHAFRVGDVGYAPRDPSDELGYLDETKFRSPSWRQRTGSSMSTTSATAGSTSSLSRPAR